MQAISIAGYANEVSNLLGLNNWDLQQAMYNGCSFMTLTDQITQLGGAAFQAAQSLTGNINKGDPNSGLFATTMHLLNARDSLKRKLIRHNIPHSSSDNIEDQGWCGFTFSMNAIFNGLEYLTGLNNFLQSVLNEQQIKTTQIGSNYHVLIHPFWGKVNDVYLSDIRLIHESKIFKGVAIELTFEASNNNITAPAIKNLAQIGKYFDMIESAIASVAQAVSLVNVVL